jgi:zinc/manganese transport system permease protein
MKRQNVKLILVEPYFDLKTPNSIAERTGAKVLVMPPSVGGVKERTTTSSCSTTTSTCWSSRSRHGAKYARLDSAICVPRPFVASLILTGIHAYLGVHVVERGVIFVDLSLAQIAALGATIALLMPIARRRSARARGLLDEPRLHVHRRGDLLDDPRVQRGAHPAGSDHRHLYAVASAAAILAMSKATGRQRAPEGHAGRQHPRGVVAEVGKTAISTALVGVFHYVFRKQFLAISMDHERAAAGERRSSGTFLFYASFGFVVTSSVSIAGVLLVFCYLIVPSVAAMLFSSRIGPRLAIGWPPSPTR